MSVFERLVNRRYLVGTEIGRGLACGLRPTQKSGCAPSAHGMQALPMVLVVPSPILELIPILERLLRCCDPPRSPGPMTHALHMHTGDSFGRCLFGGPDLSRGRSSQNQHTSDWRDTTH